MTKKPTKKNNPPKKPEPMVKAGGEPIYQGQDAFTAIPIIDNHLSKVNAARKAAGEPEPLQAYFTDERQLLDFLLDVFLIPGETFGNRLPNLAYSLAVAKYRTGEDIPWTRLGAIAYWLKAFPHSRFTPGGKALAQGLGVIPDWLKIGATTDKIVSENTNKARANEGAKTITWVEQRKAIGVKWEDLCITVAPGGTLIQFPAGKPIIEQWAGDSGFLNRREGKLLELFQEAKTLPDQDKRNIARLRKILQKVSGIQENPFISEGNGTYTRRFEMNLTRGDWGGVSEFSGGAAGAEEEEDLRDHAELYKNTSTIKTGRRR